MTVTKERLHEIDPLIKEKHIDLFLPYLNEYIPKYGIDTPLRIAAFLATILHESGHLKYTREIWGPTKQQKRYERDFGEPWEAKGANKLAFTLGNSERFDGKRFAGAGLIMTTGRRNYFVTSKRMFGDDRLLGNPLLLTTPQYAVMSACDFWLHTGLNELADKQYIKRICVKVNGGFNGLKERLSLYHKAIEVLTGMFSN